MITIQEAKKLLQEQGFYIIDYDALQTIIDNAVYSAIERYEQKKAKERLYSKKEVANILKIHPSTLSLWIKEGKVQTTPTGKITYQEILRLLSEQ